MKHDSVNSGHTNSGNTMDLFKSLHLIELNLEMDQERVIAQFLAISTVYLRTNITDHNQ